MRAQQEESAEVIEVRVAAMSKITIEVETAVVRAAFSHVPLWHALIDDGALVRARAGGRGGGSGGGRCVCVRCGCAGEVRSGCGVALGPDLRSPSALVHPVRRA